MKTTKLLKGTPVGCRTDSGALITKADARDALRAEVSTDEVIALGESELACQIAEEFKKLPVDIDSTLFDYAPRFRVLLCRLEKATYSSINRAKQRAQKS